MIEITNKDLLFSSDITVEVYYKIIDRFKKLGMTPFGSYNDYEGFKRYGRLYLSGEHWQTASGLGSDLISVNDILNKDLSNRIMKSTLLSHGADSLVQPYFIRVAKI